ncbi:hypothetical protein Vretimale_135, partial [Volvox reticuliferus]
LAPTLVGSPVLLATLASSSSSSSSSASQPWVFNGLVNRSCALALNGSCGSCANVTYNVPAALLAQIKTSRVMAIDVKLWLTKWVNYGIDNADPMFGFQQAWDRYFKLNSDKVCSVAYL